MNIESDKHELTIHEQRFYKLMRLIKIDQMLKAAEVEHKELPADGSPEADDS